MTKEEAQELIAEIDNLHKNVCDFHCDACRPDYQQIRKIINRFANKPPVNGYTVKLSGIGGSLRLMNYRETDKSYLEFWDSDDELISTGTMDTKELTQLRDNINLMLEYLSNE